MTITFTENELSSESLYEMFRLSMEEYVNEAGGTPLDDRRERAQFLDQMSVESIKPIRADGRGCWIYRFSKERSKLESSHDDRCSGVAIERYRINRLGWSYGRHEVHFTLGVENESSRAFAL